MKYYVIIYHSLVKTSNGLNEKSSTAWHVLKKSLINEFFHIIDLLKMIVMIICNAEMFNQNRRNRHLTAIITIYSLIALIPYR